MAPVTNARQIFNEVPTGYPIPGQTMVYDTTPTIDLENVPLNGGFLVKTLVVSIDPYMRGRMRDASVKSYVAAFKVGEPLENYGVCVVLRSENSALGAGDHLYGMLPFEEYSIQTKPEKFGKIKNEHNLPWRVVKSAFITAGAGAVGSLVIQFAKRDGLKVIASAGSDEKVAFMKEIGADVVFNYKTTKTSEVLAKEGPIDVYWDNVGGETLDAALAHAARYARFIECGMISGYNAAAYPIMNLMNVMTKEIKMYGFLVFKEELTKGLEGAGEAILAVQKGTNSGKSVVVVADQ
ncbi:NAD-P-binding protein [Boletus edulis]|nr:NAD-P-binding protein [Boletus edulis]